MANTPSSRKKVGKRLLNLHQSLFTNIELLEFGHPCPMDAFDVAYVDFQKWKDLQIFECYPFDVELPERFNFNL